MQISETREAYDKLAKLATSFHPDVSLISESAFEVEGIHCLDLLFSEWSSHEGLLISSHVSSVWVQAGVQKVSRGT